MSYLTWYHEHLNMGPRFEDQVFGHYNGTMMFLELVQLGAIAYAY